MAAEGKEGGRLQRSEEHFRRVVESAPNAIVMIGHTGLIEMVNAEAERVFGYTRNELLGKPVEMLVPERYRSKHPKLRTSFFADAVSRPMGAGRDLYGLRKDGSEFPVEIGLNPIQTEEGTMVLSAIVDISARRRLEERIHAIKSMLTHEINQPLAAIVANAHAALRWLSNERPNFDEARAASYCQCRSPCRGDSQKPPFDLQEGKPSRSMMSFKMPSGSCVASSNGAQR